MKGVLNQNQIDYVLHHLGHHMVINEKIKESLVFALPGEDIGKYRKKIIFLLSDQPLKNINFSGTEKIPLLFPVSKENSLYRFIEGNLVFSADLLKSSFYLLSGYQERDKTKKDSFGRFPFEASLQHKYNFLTRPVVNYYFAEITKGIGEFCRIDGYPFTLTNPFDRMVLFLTHDIDRIKYYSINNFLFKLKQFAGLKESEKSRSEISSDLIDFGLNVLNIFRKDDPYWNFKYMIEEEKNRGIHSSWFFLPADQKNVDSKYRLEDKKIKNLISLLSSQGHETGLHGTVRSFNSESALKDIATRFRTISGKEEIGIRQHRLMWDHPLTAINHEKAGIIYDTTLGFAGHEGFRNSYCHPFHLYDFDNDKMLSTWEIPLILMESTLFDYRKMNYPEAMNTTVSLLKEIEKFKGVFTMLWHNSYLNEDENEGILNFYSELFDRIMADPIDSLTGLEIIRKMHNNG
jgi:hypothetical protein